MKQDAAVPTPDQVAYATLKGIVRRARGNSEKQSV